MGVLTGNTARVALGWLLFHGFFKAHFVDGGAGQNLERGEITEEIKRYLFLALTCHIQRLPAGQDQGYQYNELKFHVLHPFVIARKRFRLNDDRPRGKSAKMSAYERREIELQADTLGNIDKEFEVYFRFFSRRIAIAPAHLPRKARASGKAGSRADDELTLTLAHLLLIECLRHYRSNGETVTVSHFRQFDVFDRRLTNDPELLQALERIGRLYAGEKTCGRFIHNSKGEVLRRKVGILHIKVDNCVVPVAEELSLAQVLECLPRRLHRDIIPIKTVSGWKTPRAYSAFINLIKELSTPYYRMMQTGLPPDLLYECDHNGTLVMDGDIPRQRLSHAKIKSLQILVKAIDRICAREHLGQARRQDSELVKQAWQCCYAGEHPKKSKGYATFERFMESKEGRYLAGLKQNISRVAKAGQDRPDLAPMINRLRELLFAEEFDLVEIAFRDRACCDRDSLLKIVSARADLREMTSFPYNLFPPKRRSAVFVWFLAGFLQHRSHADESINDDTIGNQYFRRWLLRAFSLEAAAAIFESDLKDAASQNHLRARNLMNQIAITEPFSWLNTENLADKLEVFDFFSRRCQRPIPKDWHERWSEQPTRHGSARNSSFGQEVMR